MQAESSPEISVAHEYEVELGTQRRYIYGSHYYPTVPHISKTRSVPVPAETARDDSAVLCRCRKFLLFRIRLPRKDIWCGRMRELGLRILRGSENMPISTWVLSGHLIMLIEHKLLYPRPDLGIHLRNIDEI